MKLGLSPFFGKLLSAVSPFSGSTRYNFIEGLRGICVLLVFNVHFFGQFMQSNYYAGNHTFLLGILRTLHAGHIGVDCFFIISGFLIYQVVVVSKRKITFIGFIKNRYLRLLPVIIVAIILPHIREIESIKELIDNIFFLRLFKDSHDLSVVTWSLTYEVYFYILAGSWFLFIPKSISKNWLVLISLYLIVLLSPFLFITHQIPQPSRFGGFFWGLFLGKFMEAKVDENKPLSNDLLFFLGSFFIILVMFVWINLGIATKIQYSIGIETIYYLLVQLSFIIILYACLNIPSGKGATFLSSNSLRYIGTISYSFYLVHPICLNLSNNVLKHYFHEKYLMITQFPVSIILSILMSHFLYVFLEKPYFVKHKLK